MNKNCIWILFNSNLWIPYPCCVFSSWKSHTEPQRTHRKVVMDKSKWTNLLFDKKAFLPQRVTAAPLTESLWCPTDICFIGPTTTITTTENVHANVYICCAGCFNDALPSLSGNRNPGLQFVNVQILFQCKATEPEAATHKRYLASILLGKPTYWEEN